MSTPVPVSSDVEGTAITGLRHTAPRSGTPVEAPRERTPSVAGARKPEVWETDDALESLAPVLEGELLGGKYLVEGMFAEGGMGIVCLGRHEQLDQPVAIKFLRRALSGKPTVVQRFLNEARALAALRSEHVVRVMDVGQLESGRPYLVMEHLDGTDLDALVERGGPLSIETAVRYVLQVCEALTEAHALGIVHRDIKPENLFLWSGGPGKDIVKVLDFGLSKRLDSQHSLGMTGPQDSMGSPCYMSPEQITTPQHVDSRTDVWSLGVVLYRLLTNALPFGGTSMAEVFAHVLNAAPMPLSDVLSSPDAALDAIVGRCLEKAPAARYATIAELADALNAYLALRSAGALPAVSAVPPKSAPPQFEDETKIRIPGVHARWPGVLAVLLVLASAAIYQADRTGRVRVRDATDGWLTALPLLAVGAPPEIPRESYEPRLTLAYGVFAVEPVPDANGSLTIRAEPERDSAPGGPVPETAAHEVERARQQVLDHDYLTSPRVEPAPTAPPKIDAPVFPSD